MIVVLDEMQTMLRDSARDVCAPWRGANRMAQSAYQTLWRQFGELGWTGVTLDEAHGGSGGSLLDAGIIALELGRGAIFCSYPETVALATVLAEHGGGGEMLEAVSAGTLALTLALPLGDGEGLLAEPAAPSAMLVALEGDRLVAVPADRLAARPALTTTHRADRLVNLAASAETGATLLHGPAAHAAWARAQAIHTALVCAQLTGVARQMLDMSNEYALVRVQFGHPIGLFQAVQHSLAESLALCEAAELTSFKALAACDRGAAHDDADLLASIAFVREAIWAAVMKSYDILGGVGFMEEHAFSRYTRGVLPLLAGLGTLEHCADQVAATVRKGGWL